MMKEAMQSMMHDDPQRENKNKYADALMHL
jgi:hypothetical protein